MGEFTHFNEQGHAVMVDVSEKSDTVREATAMGRISMSQECFEKVNLYITHMGEEALRLAPKALYVEKGRIVEYDDTEAVLTRHGYVREAPWIR